MTAIDVVPAVVRIRDTKMASVLITIAVAVADEGGLPVVMEVRVGDGHVIRCMSDIAETVIVVLVVLAVGAKFAVVNPHIGRSLDTNGIIVVGKDLGDLQVLNDDIFHFFDV